MLLIDLTLTLLVPFIVTLALNVILLEDLNLSLMLEVHIPP